MSVSIDNDPAEEGENARAVLASWLDDYSSGRCERDDMQESFLSVCRSNADAPWDALALLDQYQRRGRIDVGLARSLKADIAQMVFGVANQTDAPRDVQEATQDTTGDTTGSRWRKLISERDADAPAAESAGVRPESRPARSPSGPGSQQFFADPALFRREPHVTARSPPVLEHPVEPHIGHPGGSGDVLRGRYELLSVLGRGGSGTVYKALDRHRAHLSESARCVAVKVLKLDYRERPDALAELERELHQAQSLSHPNVVKVFDLDRHGDTYFVVMELLEGELLADVLHRLDGRPMSREHALAIISSIGAALVHAHRRDIVHADLKPRDVVITYGGEIRVLDFGFARNRALELHSASALHDAPVAAPAYASVERVNGSEPQRSDDVYSFACIAYELLSGQHPFGGRSAVLARAHGRRPRRISGLTRKQSHALRRALLWTRGERKIELAELLSSLGCADTADRLIHPEELLPQSRASWRLRVIAMAIFVLLGVAAAAYLFYRPDSLPRLAAALAALVPAQPDREQQVNEPAEVAALPPDTNGVVSLNQGDATPAAAGTAGSPRAAAQKAPEGAEAPKAAGTPAKPAPAVREQQNGAAAGAAPPTVEFDKDTYVATESDGSVRLRVRRGGSTRQAVLFRWSLKGNSAEAGMDFAAIGPDTEEIPARAREATITVPLVSDAVIENTELFLVEIEPAGEGVSLGERASAAVIVVDDD